MGYLQAKDIVSGQEGRAYATFDGVVEEMFYVKSIEATAEKQKEEVKVLGKRGTQSKAAGWTGTGTMTIYYTTSRFRQLMLRYIKDGIDTYFDIQIINDDSTTNIGRQASVLRNVNLDSVTVAKLDTESSLLDEEISFTFDDYDLQESFTDPVLG
ncbi:phage tail tube protein [Paenibacillus sanguinis]|uniref:phage tail tube protein n=1 Tax=Paenibacillus sanguinis TaxID=225906 RepID=UPI00035CA039|nr:phage tail tube protein [Paenibacillus sanguinis]